MSDTHYNLQWNKLCGVLQLGEIVGVPEAISGGLLHRMYGMVTTKGKYAVKALNPQIMNRPAAMQNFIDSERIAMIAARYVPALPAKQFHGVSIQKVEDQYYLVFDWADGRSLQPDEISTVHCDKMGGILAELHKADFSELAIAHDDEKSAHLTDWDHYVQLGQQNNANWVDLLLEIKDRLYDWDAGANHAAEQLASQTVISHWDLDVKNVMWPAGKPLLIDWEASGYINPMHNLIETALYWSETAAGEIDKERFLAFIGGYHKKYGILQADWKVVLENGFSGKIGWLEYSLKRSLWIECTDEKEQQTGTEQVAGTIHAIRNYADKIADIGQWLNDGV